MREIRLKDKIEVGEIVARANINGGLYEYADTDAAKAADEAKEKAFDAKIEAAVKAALAKANKGAPETAMRGPAETAAKETGKGKNRK